MAEMTQVEAAEVQRLATDTSWSAKEKQWVLALIARLSTSEPPPVDLQPILARLEAIAASLEQPTAPPPSELPEPPVLVIEPSDTITLKVGEAWNFTALTILNNALVPVDATWTATGGTINPTTGRYVAGSTAGEYKATATYGGRSDSVSILLMAFSGATPEAPPEPGEFPGGATWRMNEPVGYNQLVNYAGGSVSGHTGLTKDEVRMTLQVDATDPVSPSDVVRCHLDETTILESQQYQPGAIEYDHGDTLVGVYSCVALKFSDPYLIADLGTKLLFWVTPESEQFYFNIRNKGDNIEFMPAPAFTTGDGRFPNGDWIVVNENDVEMERDVWNMVEIHLSLSGNLKLWINGVLQMGWDDVTWSISGWEIYRTNPYHNGVGTPLDQYVDQGHLYISGVE